MKRNHAFLIFWVLIVFANCNQAHRQNLNELSALLGLSNATAPQGITYQLPQFNPAFQLNPELFDRVGKYYFQNNPTTRLFYIADVSIVNFLPELRSANASENEVNMFILDSYSGTLIFSINNSTLSHFTDKTLVGAKRILALPNGQIVILDYQGFLNTCYNYKANQIYKTAGCSSSQKIYSFISQIENSSSFLVSNGIQVSQIDSNDWSTNQIVLPSGILNIVDVTIQGNTIALIANKGNVLYYLVKDATSQNYQIISQKSDLSVTMPDGLSVKSVLSSIVFLKNGLIAAVSKTNSYIVIYKPTLDQIGLYAFLPTMRPFRGIDSISGIRVLNKNGEIYVFSNDVVQTLVDNVVQEIEESQWIDPPQLQVILSILQGKLRDAAFSLSDNLLDYPEIQSVIGN